MILYNVIESIALTMRALLLLLAFTKMVNVSFVIKHFPTNLYWYEVVLVRPIPERRMSYTKLRHHLLLRHEGILFLLLRDSWFPFINVLRKCSCKRQSTFARKGQIYGYKWQFPRRYQYRFPYREPNGNNAHIKGRICQKDANASVKCKQNPEKRNDGHFQASSYMRKAGLQFL